MSETVSKNAKTFSKARFGFVKRFNADERGVAAIEFAILALPFLLVLFAILESTLSFASQQLMAETVDRLSRDIRVGTLRKGTAPAAKVAITDRICNELEFFFPEDCPDLEVDLKVYTEFADIPTTLPRKVDNDVDDSSFDVIVGDANQIQMLRIFYRWKYMTHLIGDKVAELPDNKTLLYSAAAWKNEPFN